MAIFQEEIFGLLGVIVKLKTEVEAIDTANGTTYDLTAHIFSQDISLAIRAAHAMEVGNAFVRAVVMSGRVLMC